MQPPGTYDGTKFRMMSGWLIERSPFSAVSGMGQGASGLEVGEYMCVSVPPQWLERPSLSSEGSVSSETSESFPQKYTYTHKNEHL